MNWWYLIDAGIPDAKWRSFEATVAKHFWACVALVVVRDVSPNLFGWWFQTLNVLHTFAGITFVVSLYLLYCLLHVYTQIHTMHVSMPVFYLDLGRNIYFRSLNNSGQNLPILPSIVGYFWVAQPPATFTFPETNSLHPKIDGWNTIVSFLGHGPGAKMLVSGSVDEWYPSLHPSWFDNGPQVRSVSWCRT